MADPTIGAVALSLLPLIFFYVAQNLNIQYRPLTIFFFSLAIFFAFATVGIVMQTATQPLSGGLAALNYLLIVLWIFYILTELWTSIYTLMMSVKDALTRRRKRS
jgi:hypothetical protein